MSIKRKIALLSLIFISVLAVAFGLTACGGNKNNDDDDDDSTYTYDGNLSYLYYTITVVFDGEVAGTERVYYETGNTLNYSSYTSKTGYEFLGYYASDGVMMFDADGNQLEYGIDKDYTLYGKFSAKTYTFKYMIESDGEYVEYTTQSVVYDTTLTDLVSAPEVTGYTFKGWARSSLGSKFYSNGTNPINNTFNTSNYSINSSGVVYLYAVYSVKTFTVTLNYNYYTLTNKTITVNYGDTLPDLSDYYVTVDPTEGTYKGREVTGWSAYQNSTIEYTSQVYMDMTVYAIWTEFHIVKFVYFEDDIREKKYYYSTSSCELPTDVSKIGYTFDGWYDSETKSGIPVSTKLSYSQLKDTYYAKMDLITYTISFVYDEASYEDIQYTVESGTVTLPVIEKYGYNYCGWCTSSDLSGTAVKQIVASSSAGGYGDLTMYAKLVRYESTIYYCIDGLKIGSLSIYYGDSFTIDVPSTYLGSSREFKYWYMTDDNGDSVILTDSNGNGLDVWENKGESYNVYCSYEQLYSVKLAYTSPADGDLCTVDYGYQHVGDVINIAVNGYENYTIEGYYINNTLVSSEQEFEYTVTASDVTINAVYYQSTVDCYYDYAKIDTLTIYYGIGFSIDVPASYLGKTKEFKYWYMVDDNGDTVILTDSNGNGLDVWQYKGDSYTVYCCYEQLYSVTLTYTAPTDDSSHTVDYGYLHVGDVITIAGKEYENYAIKGYYIDNTLVSDEEFEYTVTASDVTINVEYYQSTVTYYFNNTRLGSFTLYYGDSFSIALPTAYLGSSREFKYWYMIDDDGNTVILTDSDGAGLNLWQYKGESCKVYCAYEQLYFIKFTYTAPTNGSTYLTLYGYYHVGEVVTVTCTKFDNYTIAGYYLNSTLLSDEEEFEYTMTASDVTITVEYTFIVAEEFIDEYNFPYTVYCYGSHYYAIVKLSKTWSAAKSWCEFYGGHLVTITSSSEQKWIANLLSTYDPGNYSYNIGGYYSSSAWHWVTGETFSYTNWHSGEPSSSSENYIGFYSSYTDYTWNDNSGGSAYFIIEWESAEDYITIVEKTVTDINGDSVTLTLYKYNNHYYTVVNTSMLWFNAEVYSEYIGGHLVTITTSNENNFVGTLIANTSSSADELWIGANDYDVEGTWVWVTGETFSYTNWNSGEPNNGSGNQDYGAMYATNYYWDDGYNTSTVPFIIEWESLDDVGVFTPLYAIKNITTASDFMSIQYNTAGYYILKSDITLTSSWTPVDFSGTFIGNGYTVSGITVNQSSGNAGVFLNVTGYIENVTFEVTVNSTSTSTVYVGGAVAYLNGGTLKDITVKGTVTSVSGSAYTGGVVGYYSTGTVSGLTNYATVNGSATGTGTTGGVIGRADIFGVTDLVNHGTVTGYYDVGGVIGYLHIYNSNPSETASGLVNYGDVSGDSSSGSCGGVIGVIYRSLSNTTNYSFTLDGAKNYGNVTSTSGNVGGVVGYVYLANGGNGAFVFIGEDLYNEGDVISSKGNVGGLVGYGYAKSTTSYIYGTSKANVSGTYYVGGIAGYLNNISLKQSSNAGSNVSASGNTNDGTGDCVGVGGYVGYGYNITISDCDNAVAITYTGGTFKYVGGVAGYVRGTITNCTNTAAVTSSGYEVGGVVGTFAVPSSVTVSNLTNSGAVEGTSYKVGGVFGNIWWDGSVSSNIVLTLSGITNSGDVTSSSYGAGGIAGYIYFNNSNGSYTISIQATSLINSGDVTGAYYVGGLVGYGYTESNASYITTSSSEADVTGGYYVGGLAGYLSNISLTSSSNEDSIVTATSYTSDTVYLGGYVGYGYIVSDCDNAVNINYTASDSVYYVGGIAGYLTGAVTDCSNSGDISGARSVGGIVGNGAYSSSLTLSNLTNKGNITGTYHVGGIFGELYNDTKNSSAITLTITNLTNGGTITAASYRAGGIFGYIYLNNPNGSSSGDYTLHATGLINTGAVTGDYQVGGIVGYGYTESNSSYITASSSSAAVMGTYYVGGLAGYLSNISLTNSSNADSTVTATGYTSDTVYLGGYVGYGYIVSGCDNAVNIDYTASDSVYYVGGIAGYLTGAVTDCSNSGDISGARSVGGIVGNGAYSSSLTLSNLTNKGNITGTYHVGGIFGEFYCNQSVGSTITLTLTSLTNSGTVKGSSYAVGGIVGHVYLNNTNGSYTYILHATGLINSGAVTGDYQVGGIVGYGYTESNSSYITSSSCSGAVSGEYYVGGLAGYLSNIILKDSTNEDATVSATSCDSDYHVYLGGFVGYGYNVSGLTNVVSITYNQSAWYVGGVAGYLTGTAESCTNSGTISASKASAVGGVVGGITGITGGTYSKLTNSGDITGSAYVGGVIGYVYASYNDYTSYTVYFTTLTNSGEVTSSGSYTGGVIGYMYVAHNRGGYTYAAYLTTITNTGAVKGTSYTGGLVGYGYTTNNSSYITDSSNSCTVTGTYYLGGLAGYLRYIILEDSTNEGTTITSNGYLLDTINYAYVGGYVGCGDMVNGLTNAVSITYTYNAWYVGGVAGCLTGTAENCTNSGTITASNASAVGGIAGGVVGIYGGTYTSLANTGYISANAYVGGVIGYVYASYNDYTSYTVYFTALTNSGEVNSNGSYAGGVIGYMYVAHSRGGYTYTAYLTTITNTGAVKGTSYTGGLVGYGYATNNSSYITDSSNSCTVTGTYYLGGLAGYLQNIILKDSTNEGTIVTSTGYLLDTTKYAYVGGYVGYGYSVSGLTNAVSITYTYNAWYVGGVAGCLSGTAESCTNSGTITASNASAVGGIAGGITGIVSGTYSNLTNIGSITGNMYIGGIIGYFYTYCADYSGYTIYMQTINNSGAVTASGDYAGGIVGYVYLNNSRGYLFTIIASSLENSGSVTSATDYCYGIFGYGYTNGSSTVSDYVSTGDISCDGDNSGTTYSGSNITFSN